MKKIWEELEQIIIEKYQISGQEWVQADVSKRGKIHKIGRASCRERV